MTKALTSSLGWRLRYPERYQQLSFILNLLSTAQVKAESARILATPFPPSSGGTTVEVRLTESGEREKYLR